LLDEAALGAAMLESVRLWGKNQTSEALQILDEWIARAERENEIDWVNMLCGQASMIAGWMNDLGLVKLYCEKVLSHGSETTFDWAMAHYRLADAMFRHGEVDLAKQRAARSYALVAHQTRDEDRGLLELLVKVWPEISNWKA
jgi:hypothetical protein